MKKILGAIFGSSKNTETIVDGAVAGMDKLVFTNEERAEANDKLNAWYIEYLQATQPQNLARRLIAMMVVGLWTATVVFGMIAKTVELFLGLDDQLSTFIYDVLLNVIMNPFLMIMGFYFLKHAISSYNKK